METKTETNDQTVALPLEIDDIIAIAQKVRDNLSDDVFVSVFQAAIITYYRVRFPEPFPLAHWQE
jgi:hypothetical protein